MIKQLILLCCIAFVFLSAQQAPPRTTTITFKLEKGSALYISYPLSLVQYKELLLEAVPGDTVITITVNSAIPFNIININKTHSPYLFFPGYHYTASIQKNESNLVFQCTDEEKAFECNALNNVEKNTSSFSTMLDKTLTAYTQTGQYSHELDTYLINQRNQRLEKLASLRQVQHLSDEGYRLLTAYIQYEFISRRLIPMYYPGFDPSALPTWYIDSIYQYKQSFNDPSLLALSSFQRALVYNSQFTGYDDTQKKSTLPKQFSAARRYTSSQQIADFVLYQTMNSYRNKADKRYPLYIDSFLQQCPDTLYRHIITANYKFLASEKTASTSQQLFTTQQKIIGLDSVIKGQQKIVYIDCWASWCAPCKRELAYSAALQQEFKGTGVAFLFLSLDSDAVAWSRAMSDYSFMTALNSFLITNNYQSPFARKYRIQGIPRYLIFGSDGRLIDENAPRPSDPKLKELLRKLAKS
ncbi:TlpA disulfide reductase family protein [Chitinophaga sp. 212800010-3]|uniref:TlpA family protein disulfide reductase n=1 Tax=unclassified Chitinophaga TaxID=2619133 RepID=UPI002DE355C2|nr:Thiol-disulfide isomerase/thioredoxin [Chitinophaga sp. 212800010-3]